MLQYQGENHGLAQAGEPQDYTVRMREFFDHYLMEKPAPDWLEDGVPQLKMPDHITERLKAQQEKENKIDPAAAKKGGGR